MSKLIETSKLDAAGENIQAMYDESRATEAGDVEPYLVLPVKKISFPREPKLTGDDLTDVLKRREYIIKLMAAHVESYDVLKDQLSIVKATLRELLAKD